MYLGLQGKTQKEWQELADAARNTNTRVQLQAEMVLEDIGVVCHAAIMAVLKERFSAGGKLTKRVEGWVKAKLPDSLQDATVSYTERYGMMYIIIRQWRGTERALECECFVGYERDVANYTPELFDERGVRHGKHAAERQAHRLRVLHSDWPERVDDARRQRDDLITQAEHDYQLVVQSKPQ